MKHLRERFEQYNKIKGTNMKINANEAEVLRKMVSFKESVQTANKNYLPNYNVV